MLKPAARLPNSQLQYPPMEIKITLVVMVAKWSINLMIGDW
jgi:hypothetical protein